jgi:hypothetical protein
VDDRLDSPETVTLKYEEAARAANGGDPAGDSPPRLLEMATFGKGLPSMHGKFYAAILLGFWRRIRSLRLRFPPNFPASSEECDQGKNCC